MPTIEIKAETAALLAQYLALRCPQMIDAASGEIVPASVDVAADMLLNMALWAELDEGGAGEPLYVHVPEQRGPLDDDIPF
jgi:hypothetical protein